MVVGALLMAALYRFVTFEQTAIPTVPREASGAVSSRP
jgi:hypothetical protein